MLFSSFPQGQRFSSLDEKGWRNRFPHFVPSCGKGPSPKKFITLLQILLDKRKGHSYNNHKAMTKRDGIGCLQRAGGWCEPVTEDSNVL